MGLKSNFELSTVGAIVQNRDHIFSHSEFWAVVGHQFEYLITFSLLLEAIDVWVCSNVLEEGECRK